MMIGPRQSRTIASDESRRTGENKMRPMLATMMSNARLTARANMVEWTMPSVKAAEAITVGLESAAEVEGLGIVIDLFLTGRTATT
jgi:hypothetical protein